MGSRSAKRMSKNWNIENRAIKEIEKHKGKPKMAPKHGSTQHMFDEFQRGKGHMFHFIARCFYFRK